MTIRDTDGDIPSVLIAHSFPLMVEALSGLVAGLGFDVVERLDNGTAVRAAMAASPVDIALLDTSDRIDAVEILREIRVGGAPTRVVLLCGTLDPAPLMAAVELGVDGLLLTTAPVDTVHACVSAVGGGRQWVDQSLMKVVLDRVTAR
ncbi:MAG: hypothetical protein ACRYG4_00735, partial [Janthinobacterium lividum]